MKLKPFYIVEPKDWFFSSQKDVLVAKKRALAYLKKNGTYTGAEKEIEEFIRQWVLSELITTYNYPKGWFSEFICIEEPVKMGSSEKEADIALKNKVRRPYLFIETKVWGLRSKEYESSERQLESYLSSTHTATIGMITDGYKTKVIRKKVDPNDFDYIPDIPDFTKPLAEKSKLVRELPSHLKNSKKTGLKIITEKYERILFECHNAMRDIDGLHPDEALDELSKIIFTKIYDERQVSQKKEGTDFQFQVYGASNISEAASSIRGLYESAREHDIELYSKRIPNYERSRGVFRSQIRLSDAALFRVVELLQNYSLVDSSIDVKGRAFQKILGSAIRAGMGQYFTPDPVVKMAVELIAPEPSSLILDPFCGSGHFLSKCIEYINREYGGKIPEYNIHQFKFFHLHGIEKSERMVRIAVSDMLLFDDGHSNIRNTDALLSFENYPDMIKFDKKGNPVPGIFDVVLTNPPFGSIMKSEVSQILKRFELGSKRKSLPLEIVGLERCIQFLKPGGKLAIVLPDSILATKTTNFVRDWLNDKARIVCIISLPLETFYPYGAAIKTSLCFFQKWVNEEEKNEKYDVPLLDLVNIGYEATGRNKSGSEVMEAIDTLRRRIKWN